MLPEPRKSKTDDISLEKIDPTTARVGTGTITQDVDRKKPDDVVRTPKELRHLDSQDWMMLSEMFLELENEKENNQIH